MTNLDRTYEVNFDLYTTTTTTSITALNDLLAAKSYDAEKASGQIIELGTPVYVESCIAIGDSRHFFGEWVALSMAYYFVFWVRETLEMKILASAIYIFIYSCSFVSICVYSCAGDLKSIAVLVNIPAGFYSRLSLQLFFNICSLTVSHISL